MIRVTRALAVAVAFGPLSALAQTTPGGTLGPPPGGTIGEDEPKKEGAAEKAPKEQTPLPTLPPLPPYPGQDHKKFELVEIDGYMRLRADWLSNFNLGFHDFGQGVPFFDPLTCRDASTNAGHQPVLPGTCDDSIGSSNMRVRLEPTINLSETVHLHLQIDVLDNLVLGSTALGAFPSGTTIGTSTSQGAVESGKNSPWSSIRAKQAWADVKTPLGALKFGRMPSHWGLGISSNSGGYDWVHDTTCTDCDYGDTVDRFMFGTTIPGTTIQAAVGLDWAATSPSTAQFGTDKLIYLNTGQPYDADDSDDANQYVVILSNMSQPEEWRTALREGKSAFDWGLQFFYRTQDFEVATEGFDPNDPTSLFVARNSKSYIPDLWARFTSNKLVLEAELVGVFGDVDNLLDTSMDAMTLAQLGGVARIQYFMLGDDLELGGELGFASGDQWEDTKSGNIHVDRASYLPKEQDSTLSRFQFSRDYHVDLILWRELYGAVTNAVYGKPWVRYNITDRFWFRAAGVMSFAPKPVSTPGNSSFYGIELDGDVGYNNESEGFFAGLSYGVLFPMGALDHPNTFEEFALEPSGNAGTAQTFQARVVLKF